MPITITPVQGDFVARVTGVDLRQPLSAEDRDAIVRACDAYGVLVFPGQLLEKEELVAFGHAFGEVDTTLQKKLLNHVQNRLGMDTITDISNVDAEGQVAGPEHWQTITTVGNRFWHSDGSYKHQPIRYSILNAVTAVARGGETQYADLRAAYDDLDPVTRDWIADKVGQFWSHNTRDMLKIPDTEAERGAFPKARWPLVRTHPGSGRKVLWCDSKTYAIEGLPLPEGRALVHELIEHIGQREHVYSHHWTPGDLVMADNRCTVHRGRRFDHAERREMRRVETTDDSLSLGEAA
ncbi:TauD/TfdA dioxygenase family protein [Novosphingobium sp. JCM 18896]|uniref:TauD/TfdA dioxygenase family protein n=1 Tax=Novosphingobium sp. JCM 18896 TaxID=2989731 RepID=UPI0022223B2D|nr:TauD/TfdA family dioxygenase [Novosphingobium sp. JCM 18896]MCW1427541.1 TauD/TfdA family dioxygenase [Novosphingobium sp. JCM 18896]